MVALSDAAMPPMAAWAGELERLFPDIRPSEVEAADEIVTGKLGREMFALALDAGADPAGGDRGRVRRILVLAGRPPRSCSRTAPTWWCR